MSNIRKMIGVCPQVLSLLDITLKMQLQKIDQFYHTNLLFGLQFDVLWDALSAREHLHLFANIKGLPPSTIKSVCAFSGFINF